MFYAVLYKEDAVFGCLLISLCIFIKWTFRRTYSLDYTQHFETLIMVNTEFIIFVNTFIHA